MKEEMKDKSYSINISRSNNYINCEFMERNSKQVMFAITTKSDEWYILDTFFQEVKRQITLFENNYK